jgi:translation elongation factor EF-G
MVYIAKLVLSVDTDEPQTLFAVGRVFSGTLVAGQPVRIHGPDYTPGKKVRSALSPIKLWRRAGAASQCLSRAVRLALRLLVLVRSI